MAASAALATFGLLTLRARSRRASTRTASSAPAAAADLARWRALFLFQPRTYARAVWAASRQQWALPPHRAAQSTFAALRAAHAFFREQDAARAQLWLTRHHELRQPPGDADALTRASAELRCWSALQALASGAPDDLARAELRTFVTLDGTVPPSDAAEHAAQIIDAVRSAASTAPRTTHQPLSQDTSEPQAAAKGQTTR